ncbi:hypothetical protein NCLIV_016920 [Neospora caninum Liverpool]|uniref:Syntaxin binding protein n=1 Tax=Neospora caninum (strain Liverpool) TaxID=572307 RepID=F0VDV7_NEOCL|nr:hypothetical protein NCLIV_016920 [Neospora caninum Liverpool]CBZ51900.1 hypothetical protein NCLIV_016920 [Neospora caninum Liverpool]|eukprot:XP_003881933.1 hypothetical protein NCLIV_016920 [Neospora caninum Liverpool]
MALKAICRRRLLDEMVRHSTRGQNYIVMLVDDRSLRILSACCNVYDVLEEGVTVVEPVSKKRQPLPELDALYFVSPEAASVDAILRDFETEKNQYNRIQIYFTSPLPPGDKVLRRFAECPRILPRIRAFAEFNLDFVVQEQRIFHLDRPADFAELFHSPDSERLEQIATHLFTLCASLGEKPAVRFQKNLRGCAKAVATSLYDKLRHAHFKQTADSGEATLLIVDRSIDLATLFVHEYTYQALVYDLLNIATSAPTKPHANTEEDEDTIREDTFQYEIVSNLGKHEMKRAVLGEQDELWVRFRHQHIQAVNQEVQEEIKRFIKENATAQIQKQEGQGATLQAIRSLPQYQEMLAKYWVHVSLTEKSFDQLQERNLMHIGLLEQDLACGVDKDGKEVGVSKILSTLTKHLSDGGVKVEDKLRLLLLYFTQMTGLSPSDRANLMEAAQLSLASEETVQKFLKLELHQDSVDTEAGPSRPAHRLERDKDRRKFFKRRAKTAAYELSRFEPFVKVLMERALVGDLHGGNYPLVEEARSAPKALSSRLPSAAEQMIGRATEWDWSAAWNATSTAAAPADPDRPRKKLILFVLGGITLAEMRCAYEVSNGLGADVILGAPPS